jgi:hypothetical protein
VDVKQLFFVVLFLLSFDEAHGSFSKNLSLSATQKLDVTIVEPNELAPVFEFLKSQFDIPYENMERSCEARAHLYAYRLEKQFGIKAFKIFIHGDGKNFLVAELPKKSGKFVQWDWHVVAALAVRVQNQVQVMVLDPTVYDTPVGVEIWYNSLTRLMKTPAFVYYSNRFSYVIGDHYNPPVIWTEDSFQQVMREMDSTGKSLGLNNFPQSCRAQAAIVLKRVNENQEAEQKLKLDITETQFLTNVGAPIESAHVHRIVSKMTDSEYWDVQSHCKPFENLPYVDCKKRYGFFETPSVQTFSADVYLDKIFSTSAQIFFFGENHENHKGQIYMSRVLEKFKRHAPLEKSCLFLERDTNFQGPLDLLNRQAISAQELMTQVGENDAGLHLNMLESAQKLKIPVFAMDFPNDGPELDFMIKRGDHIDRDYYMAQKISQSMKTQKCGRAIVHVGSYHVTGPRAMATQVCAREFKCHRTLLIPPDNAETAQLSCQDVLGRPPRLPTTATGYDVTGIKPLILMNYDRQYVDFGDFQGILFIP